MPETFMTLSDYFNSFVEKASAPEAYKATVQQGVYRDDNGNEAVVLKSTLPDGNIDLKYYVNDKPVKSLKQEIIDLMDFEEVESQNGSTSIPKTLPSPLVKGSEDLQFDMAITDNELVINADVRGISPEAITVTFGGVYLNIEVSNVEAINNATYIVKSLKTISNCKKQIYIDESKFSIRDLSFEVANGLLTIRIPKNDTEANVIVFKPKASKNNKPERTRKGKNTTPAADEDSVEIDETLSEEV